MKVSDRALQFVVVLSLALASTSGVRASPAEQGSPVDLVRQTVEHEIKANNGGAKFEFRDCAETVHGSQTKLVIESGQATAGILVAINGKPLTPQQREAEEQRLARLVNFPEELRKKQKMEREDTNRTTRIVRALPDAFLYEQDGTETGRQALGKPGVELVRLKFRPNPNYEPPSHVEQVLTGMQGIVLIDPDQHRIAMIDGALIKEVSFGWGILGRLYKGGHFLVQQGEVGDGDWEVTRMDLAFTGKELLFRSINIKSTETFTDFRSAPANLTFAQAVELLEKESAELAENQTGNGGGPSHK